MSPSFSEDDIGKAVATEGGTKVGEVTDVEGETAYVDPDPGIADSIAAALGWGETSDRPLPLESDAVAEVGDETIRLEGEYATEGGGDTGGDHGEIAEGGADADRGAETDDVDREMDADEFGQDETDADAGALAENESADETQADRQDETDLEPDD